MAVTDPERASRTGERDPAWHGIDPTRRDARRTDEPLPSLQLCRVPARLDAGLAAA